jgi:hypothetical protein
MISPSINLNLCAPSLGLCHLTKIWYKLNYSMVHVVLMRFCQPDCLNVAFSLLSCTSHEQRAAKVSPRYLFILIRIQAQVLLLSVVFTQQSTTMIGSSTYHLNLQVLSVAVYNHYKRIYHQSVQKGSVSLYRLNFSLHLQNDLRIFVTAPAELRVDAYHSVTNYVVYKLKH